MPSDTHVQDIDRGWMKARVALAAADGLELRVGVLNWRLTYPKEKGKVQVSKVAAILGVYRVVVETVEARQGTVDVAMAGLHDYLLSGGSHPAQYLYEQIGIPLRNEMRRRAMTMVTRRSGRMEATIRATVFENVRPGRRGPPHAGEVAAGDDPKRPRASDTPDASE